MVDWLLSGKLSVSGYAYVQPVDRGIMFSGCPSVFACVRAQAVAFSDWLVVDFFYPS